MKEETRAEEELTQLGIPHRTFRHAGKVASLEQAASERGQRPEQVVRSLLFRISAGQFVMVLAPGTSQVSWRRLRGHIGQSRLSLASPEEVLQVTGYRIGTVSPFGLPHKLSLLVDRSILREEEISIGSSEAGIGIILSTHDLMRALPEAEQVDLIAKA